MLPFHLEPLQLYLFSHVCLCFIHFYTSIHQLSSNIQQLLSATQITVKCTDNDKDRLVFKRFVCNPNKNTVWKCQSNHSSSLIMLIATGPILISFVFWSIRLIYKYLLESRDKGFPSSSSPLWYSLKVFTISSLPPLAFGEHPSFCAQQALQPIREGF